MEPWTAATSAALDGSVNCAGHPWKVPRQAGRQAGRCGVVQALADESAVLTGETPNRREQALHQGPC